MKVLIILTIFLYFNLIEGYKQLNQKCMGNDNFCEIYYTESEVKSDNDSLVFVSNEKHFMILKMLHKNKKCHFYFLKKT